jgi:antitoxin ParD1/3/4
MTYIHLSEQDRAFVEEQIQTGIYENADAVIAAGLRLLGSEEGKMMELQRLLQEGLDDVEAGRVYEYETAEDLLKDIQQMAGSHQAKTMGADH